MSGSVLPLVVYFKSECWEVLSEYWSTLPLIKNSSFITILTCGQIESTDVSGSSWVNWKKKLNLGDPLQSTTSHLRQSSKSSFLLDLPSIPAPASIWIWTAQPVIFSFVVWVLVKRFKVSRITALSSPSSQSETKRSVAAAVLHERETESWQRLFDIYEEFIQQSGTCPWIFRMRGFVISTGFALW